MSFILDALRKSEHERQRQLGPTIAELPVARPGARVPGWIWIALAGLLALNVAILGWFLLREPAGPPPLAQDAARTPPAPAPAPTPVATAAPAVSTPTSAPAPAPVAAPITAPAVDSPLPAPAVAPGERNVRPLVVEAAPSQPADMPTFAAPEAPDPALLPVAPPPAPRSPPSVAAGVPSIDQLPAQATAGLPALNLDLHIYANQPAQRAVFINGARYREGDALPGGARVQQITPEGAVLSYGGQRFLLPRQ